MKVTVILVVVSVPETVPKGLKERVGEQEINGILETAKTTALFKFARIITIRVLDT